MTKKQKLIKWAKDKFERDPNGEAIIIFNEITFVGKFDIPYLTKEIYDFNNLVEIEGALKGYNHDLKYSECIPPPEDDEKAYEEWMVEYGDLEDDINLEDIKVIGYYWKSSEDIKYFEEN